MARKSNKPRRRNKQRSDRSAVTKLAVPLKSVPLPRNSIHPIRRTWQQDITYYGTQGWFNTGSQDFQIQFAGSASNINVGGTALFGPVTPNSAELSNLFDQWRMKGATVRIDWEYNSYPVSSGNAVAPLIYYVADYDDGGSANSSALCEYPGVRTHSFLENGYKPLIVHVKPKPLRDVASTGILTAYGPMINAPWLRTADLTTPHYGLKFATSLFGLGGTALIGTIHITCYLDMEFANPK